MYIYGFTQDVVVCSRQTVANLVVDFDSIYNNLLTDNKLTIIVFRAKNSTVPGDVIEPIDIVLENYSTYNLNMLVFERSVTFGNENAIATLKVNGSKEKINFKPGWIFITSENKMLLEYLIEYSKNAGLNLNYIREDNAHQKSNFIQYSGEYSTSDELNNILRQLVSKLNFDFYFSYFQMQNQMLKHDVDSLENIVSTLSKNASLLKNDIESIKTNGGFSCVVINSSLNRLSFPSTNKIKSDFSTSYSGSYFYKKLPNLKFLGFGIEFNYGENNFTTTGLQISDTLSDQNFDKDGDMFYKVVYCNNLIEEIDIKTLSITPMLSFSFFDDFDDNKVSFSINPGLKITHLLDATYKFTSGTLSYGAIYPFYCQDTIFSGMYDNVQDVAPISITQNLKLNPTVLSLNLPIYINYNFSKHVGISLGGYYEYGLTNILNSDQSDKILSYNPNTINSTLYRYDELKIRRYGIFLGLNYRF